jgi:hypothetical protein
MRKIYILMILFTGLSSFVLLDTYKTTGGHPSATGAPGEATCADATTGCHSNAVIKKDTTNVVNTFTFSSADSSYTPGQTYTITLSAQKSGIEKFGFEIVALTKSANANTGTWVITDATRTHTIVGSGSLSTRKYVTHSTAGTPAVSSGLGQWSFNWKAPATNVGNIKFYYTTSCTNNNNANTGVQLFLSSFEIHPSASASISQFVEKSKFTVSYEASSSKLMVKYRLKKSATSTISIFDVQGKMVQNFTPMEKIAGVVSDELYLNSGLSKGMYLVHLNVNGQELTEKILIQ